MAISAVFLCIGSIVATAYYVPEIFLSSARHPEQKVILNVLVYGILHTKAQKYETVLIASALT